MISFAHKLLLITLLTRINGSLQATCDENEFKCTNEQCIDSYLVCDGEKNCEDGSDETRQVCSANSVCQPFAFRCAYGACIDGTKKCNGKADCADNSDENHPDCSSTPVSGTSSNSCPLGSFKCNSGQCINEYSVCDGEEHCRDGSDESDATCVNFPCPEIVGFQCAYGGCIDKDKKCNGFNDCKDGSDEEPKVCRPTVVPLPGSGQSGTGSSSSKQEIIKCILKQWTWLQSNHKTRNSAKMFSKDFSKESDPNSSIMLLLEQCLAKLDNNALSPWDSFDEIYGKYVMARLNDFDEDRKIEIRNRVDKIFYFEYKRKYDKTI